MIKKIDHLVLLSADLAATTAFYRVAGFLVRQDGTRLELFAGDFKINVYAKKEDASPRAQTMDYGTADLCFEVNDLDAMRAKFQDKNIPILSDIVQRTGAKGRMKSLYVRDPDGNLLEFSQYNC